MYFDWCRPSVRPEPHMARSLGRIHPFWDPLYISKHFVAFQICGISSTVLLCSGFISFFLQMFRSASHMPAQLLALCPRADLPPSICRSTAWGWRADAHRPFSSDHTWCLFGPGPVPYFFHTVFIFLFNFWFVDSNAFSNFFKTFSKLPTATRTFPPWHLSQACMQSIVSYIFFRHFENVISHFRELREFIKSR